MGRIDRKTDFTHSSRKAWSLLRKLGSSTPLIETKTQVKPDEIAIRIVETSKAPNDKKNKNKIIDKLNKLKKETPEDSELSQPITIDEISSALLQIKNGKAAGFDEIYPDFLTHSGKNVKRWLSRFFTNIIEKSHLPVEFKRSKIIAVLKPGKDANMPENYRPIALLSSCYKLFERILYNRINPIIDAHIPNEQAGFRTGRSCSDQVLSLTSFIEAGYQLKKKTSAVFIDLTAAYDTVWRIGLIYKFIKIVRCLKLARVLNNMLSNRSIKVLLNDKYSKPRLLNNGLPQGSVLAPLLFNLYISDLPNTNSKRFAYADDIVLATQNINFHRTEEILSEDLITMSLYFKSWRLRPNLNKTEVSCFHLHNRSANFQPSVTFDNVILKYNQNPKYLGVTLDRTLSYKKHLNNTASKLKTRNNIIQKLAGTMWGASAKTLRTAALSLVYSCAEYCSPVWLNSAHTQLIDSQLNTTMRFITGTLKPTPIRFLPVLSHIEPPMLRRSKALLKEYNKITDNQHFQVNDILADLRRMRLVSRNPSLITAENLLRDNFNSNLTWRNEWEAASIQDLVQITNPTVFPPGYNLPRKLWKSLNRIRCGVGRSQNSLFQWGYSNHPFCDCGEIQTINHILLHCENRKYNGELEDVYNVSDDFLVWLNNLDINL